MIQHKQGDTFDLSGPLTLTEASGAAVNFADWVPRAQLRDQNHNLVAEPSTTWLDPEAGIVRLHVPASETREWRTGALRLDIQLTSIGGTVISTKTAEVQVVRDITQ